MNWLALFMEALDEHHDAVCGNDYSPCSCYEDLRDAIQTSTYRFPRVKHTVEEAQKIGCETPQQAYMRQIGEDFRRGMESLSMITNATYVRPKNG